MRRTFVAALGAALTLLAVALPASADNAGGLPAAIAIGNTTTISWSGIAGVYVELPEGSQDLTYDRIIRLGEGTSYAMYATADHEFCEGRSPGHPAGWSCFEAHWPEVATSTLGTITTNERFHGDGRVHGVYLFADGPAEVTWMLDEPVTTVADEVEITATGQVDAIVEEFGCDPTPVRNCRNVAYGGATHEIGTERLGATVALSTVSVDWRQTPVGSNSVASNAARGCVYPGEYFTGYSADPEEYPMGCEELTDNPRNPQSAMAEQTRRATGLCCRITQTDIHLVPSRLAHGEVYIGYQGFVADPDDPFNEGSAINAWGFWINEGIR